MKLPSLTRKRVIVAAAALLVALPAAWTALKVLRNPDNLIWFPTYARDVLTGRYAHGDEVTDLFFLMTDHWEPGGGQRSIDGATRWLAEFEPVSRRHLDSDGRNFRYSWFYPLDKREPAIMAALSAAAGRGLGEVEVHWHHRHDSAESFAAELRDGLTFFTDHGALIDRPGAAPRWAFIHGNWALDNSLPDHCGVPTELAVLMDLGCYADFTFPAPGNASQPSRPNRISWAMDTPGPKSYDDADEATVGTGGQGLLIFQGPLGLDYRDPVQLFELAAIDDARGTGVTGMIARPATPADYFNPSRIPTWHSLAIGVSGRPQWAFVKVHAHGMQSMKLMLDEGRGGQMDAMLAALEQYCARHGIRLHYITAREAFNLVRAAEQGLEGEPSSFYDLEIPRPLNCTAGAQPPAASR